MSEDAKEHFDPLIEEVRLRRKELLAHFGNDLNRFLAAIQERQKQHPEKIGDHRPERYRIKNGS